MKDTRLSALGFIHVGADAILRRPDRIVRHTLVVDSGRVVISLVRPIGRTVALDRADVLVIPV